MLHRATAKSPVLALAPALLDQQGCKHLPDRPGLSHHWRAVWPSLGALPGPAPAGSTVLAGQVTVPCQLPLMWCTAMFPAQFACPVVIELLADMLGSSSQSAVSDALAGVLGSSCQYVPGVVAVTGHSYMTS